MWARRGTEGVRRGMVGKDILKVHCVYLRELYIHLYDTVKKYI